MFAQFLCVFIGGYFVGHLVGSVMQWFKTSKAISTLSDNELSLMRDIINEILKARSK